MTPGEEIEAITNRIRTEIQIRKKLDEEEFPNKGIMQLLQSKIGLLVLGAIITGVLVPIFQASQETIKWARQNRYDNLKFKTDAIRHSIRELSNTHSYIAESSVRLKSIITNSSNKNEYLTTVSREFTETQSRRLHQNAVFIGTLSFIRDGEREIIRELFNEYLSAIEQYNSISLTLIKQSHVKTKNTLVDEITKLEEAKNSLETEIKFNYERIMKVLKTYLHEMEVQNEKYF